MISQEKVIHTRCHTTVYEGSNTVTFRKVIKSPIGRALGGILKGVAKKALPVVGGALGSMVAPGVGTAGAGRPRGAAPTSHIRNLRMESMQYHHGLPVPRHY